MKATEQTGISRRTLAQQTRETEGDVNEEFRGRLRQSSIRFRERASVLAGEISQDLTHLTVHDVTHTDALWQIADLIVGAEYLITPTEAFILGGAFLLHDLRMALASYLESAGQALYGQSEFP